MTTIQRMLGGAGLALLLAASASADVVHDNYTVKGGALSASWHWTDGCMHTSVTLYGNEQRFRATGGTTEESSGVGMEVVRFDHCTFDLVEMWSDPTTTGGVTLDRTTSGIVDTTISLVGDHCGNLDGTGYRCDDLAPETFDLYAELTGTGDVSTGRSVSTGRYGSGHYSNHYAGKNRDATATGSFVFHGTELLVGDAYARLEQVTSGTQSITHR